MTKVLFDTSVIVAGLWLEHPEHQKCLPWLQQVQTQAIQGIICTRTLAELYRVLTSLPIKPRLSPRITKQLIDTNLKHFEIIPLTTEDYQQVVEQMVKLNIMGGVIYDALIAQIAIKHNIDQIVTLNAKDFTRLSNQIAQLVIVP
jgi:predicted nucleic acid-binding protein